MSQYLDKDGASRIAENFLSKQAEQDAILANLQFDLKEAEHALVKTIQGPAPLNIRALTRPLDDYLISGNTIQNGTPTPDNPVDVVGCGEKTDNLAYGRIDGVNIDANGMISGFDGFDVAIGHVEAGIVYTANTFVYAFYTNEPTINSQSYDSSRIVTTQGLPSTFTAPITGYVAFRLDSGEQAMLNLGSTALPYEPYGYKLPLTIGGTEHPIYLGQVETTRRIKKLVLTGEENWSGSAKFRMGLSGQIGTIAPICTHYQGATTAWYGELADGKVTVNGGINLTLAICDETNQTSIEDWKSYLAAQYANGTPVTVWYVLAEPETGIVNEPLHKIGNYVDTISMAQSGVEISTTKGFDTITTDTTVLPSNIEVKGVINNA